MTDTTTRKPRGRRPGRADTKATIRRPPCRCSRPSATTRSPCGPSRAKPDVDPALIHHYFASKSDLFAQTVLDLPLDAELVVAGTLAGPKDEIGARAIRAFLAAYDSPDGGRERFTAMLRSAVAEDIAHRPLSEFMSKEVFGPIAEQLGHRDYKLRGQLAVSLVLGVALSRYILRLPTLESAPDEDLVAGLGRAMQQILVEPW